MFGDALALVGLREDAVQLRVAPPRRTTTARPLIEATKAFMAKGNGFYSKADPALSSQTTSFYFEGEILGPR